MKSRYLQPRLLSPAKLSFRIKGEIKGKKKWFPDKKKLKEFFIITKPLLYKVLKALI